jgi:hypothetical protein
MATASGADWKIQFGIADQSPPIFFSHKEQIDAAAQLSPQAHILRRAFNLLELNGVLCSEYSPLAYFKQVERIEPAFAAELHQRFWNHGGAPVLVLIAQEEVQIYSGLARPGPEPQGKAKQPGFVQRLRRVSEELRNCLLSLESGEFFHLHKKAFNPEFRVDRELLENLQDTRKMLAVVRPGQLDPQVLDALLCRLVFTCYLFDREIVGPAYLEQLGIPGAAHLRDILLHEPKLDARDQLYKLFEQLGEDFNGDLFSDDLKAEAELIRGDHIGLLRQFFSGTAVRTGQQSFWPYDFGVIPVETISAIYERFLKAANPESAEGDDRRRSKKKEGAFYTPRFLAEVVIDLASEGMTPLLGKRFLDPACGSGIFLVGLFNRLAEEWTRKNPTARNDRRAKELMALLRGSLFGVDRSRTACRIAAFSLYLAYLDHLLPRDIQELQKKGREKGPALPRLIIDPEIEHPGPDNSDRNIWRGDFFAKEVLSPNRVDLVIGNPPWGSHVTDGSAAALWCEENEWEVPDRQIADVFVGKGPCHLAEGGRVCFLLPHGVIFNHGRRALRFQRGWFERHAVERVVSLVDYQRFLFAEAGHPAIMALFRKPAPVSLQHLIHYWAPKADWAVTQAEVVTVQPQDRSVLTLRDVLEDLRGADAPQIWKRRHWATPRDWRLIDRLGTYPRLRELTGRPGLRVPRRWLVAEGFQPLGENDDADQAETIQLPSKWFVKSSCESLDLFLLTRDCQERDSDEVTVRNTSNKNTHIFQSPHVLVAKGFTSTAYADFPVSFQHAVRGIHGPPEDRSLLIFLAAYLRSPLARYYLFHTSSNWGVSRQEIHVAEMLRLPFPLPKRAHNQEQCAAIVEEVARIITSAMGEADKDLVNREDVVRNATASVEPLVEEYFDVDHLEKMLIEDTVRVIIPSTRPTRQRTRVPTILPANQKQRDAYTDLLCGTLNEWAKEGPFQVSGRSIASDGEGVGLVALEKFRRGEAPPKLEDATKDLAVTLDRLRSAISAKYSVFDLVRGLKVFDRNRLFAVKPIGQRFWTRTSALNDADEIAGTILMRAPREGK